jgi:urease accessory protein
MIKTRLPVFLLGLLGLAPLALAHPGHLHDSAGFLAGVLHPLTGVDHVLFMLAVGVLVALRVPAAGRGVLLSIPVAQVLAVAAMWLPVSIVAWEPALAVSLIAISVLLWRARGSRAAVALAVLGAGLHAAVHWVEMPAGADAPGYGLGMLAASVLLYLLGSLVGIALRPFAERAARAFGITLAGGGLWMLLPG